MFSARMLQSGTFWRNLDLDMADLILHLAALYERELLFYTMSLLNTAMVLLYLTIKVNVICINV